MINKKSTYANVLGFSLVEMAVVLVVLGFVLGALLLPLQAQRNHLFQSQTESTLELAKRALLGYAQQNGRLPCPATATANFDAGSNGLENPLGGTKFVALPGPPNNCASQSGYLPAATLGIQPVDAFGFALDAWGNRIRYAVANDNSSALAVPYDDPNTSNFDIIRTVNASHPACGGDVAPDFTTIGDMSLVGLACLTPNLSVVCGTITTSECTAGTALITNAVAIVFSTGKNFGQSAGVDEASNLVATHVFYSRNSAAPTPAPSNEFDDIVTWVSPYVLYNAMIEAGQLH